MAKHSAALTRLLVGLDDPDSQDPAGFGREDVAKVLLSVPGLQGKNFNVRYGNYLHSPDYSRAGLARQLRALKGLS